MLHLREYNRGMKDQKETSVTCWECEKQFPNRVSLVQRISYLWFCKPCWAVHPWNPDEVSEANQLTKSNPLTWS
jgi:hypothetical protein